MKLRYPVRVCVGLAWLMVGLNALGAAKTPGTDRFVSRAETPPRKVVVASAVAHFTGTVEARLELIAKLTEESTKDAARQYAGKGLDLIVFPEFAVQREGSQDAKAMSVRLDGEVLRSLSGTASRHQTWMVVPMVLEENAGKPTALLSNAAVLFDRTGKVAGIFRKVHPMPDKQGTFEGGVKPGRDYPVFDCDFGKLGVLICWDMSYEDAWRELGKAGAEVVALPSASPQTIRPSAAALRNRYYVVTATPRDNASLFDPIGRVVAQEEKAPGVLVHQIDLSYAILHWAEPLLGGQAFTDKYGARVGYEYSNREDTGVFWSNDPKLIIGNVVREFGLQQMPEAIEDVRIRGDKVR